jgi:serine protease Do
VQPLRFGDSDALEIGDWVIAVGSPFGLQQTVTHGIVSAKGRSRIPGVDIDYQDFIQTDAAINPGNSGGPLLNLRGEVVGVNTAIATRGDGFNAGVAFTIPSKLAMRIANELRTSGTVQRGWIGVSYLPVDAGYAELFGLSGKNGILITAVQRRSPADRAGLQVDDVVVEINGKPIDNSEQFRSAIADMRADERVKLRLVRDGQSRVIDLRLAAQPEQTRENFEKNWIQGRSVARLGIEARTHPPESVSNLTEGAASGGVLVVRLSELGLRASELRPLESIIISCNGKPVRTVRELNDLLQAARPAERYALDVLDRTGERRTVIIQPDAERDRDR